MKRTFACLLAALLLPSCIFPADEAKGVQYPSPLVLTQLTVTLARASLYIGQTTTAVATGIDQFGNSIAIGPVTYTSSNLAAATISEAGVVTALSPGLATIAASTPTKHAETLLQVSAPSVLAALHLLIPTVRVGFAITATLTGQDQYGVPFVPVNAVWMTSAPGIATVSQNGVVTGVATGQATISAQSQGIAANAAVNVISAAPTVQSVVLEGARRVKVGDEYVYTPIITLTDGTIANLPVTFALAPPTDGLITSNGHFTPLRKGLIGINATVNNATFTTSVTGYNWSTPFLNGTNAEVEIESDVAVVRGGVNRFPYLSISCSVTADPQYPELNIGVGGINVPGDTAGTSVQYSIDDSGTKNETWEGPRRLPFLSSVYLFTASTNAARVDFVKAVASSKTLAFTFKQTLEGPRSMSFRLSGMQAAIAPVLAACGVN